MKVAFSPLKAVKSRLAVSIMALGFMTGCAHSPIELSDGQAIEETKGAAFGNVKTLFRGEVRKSLFTMSGGSTISLLILPDDSTQGSHISLREDGYFFLQLTPGGYTIVSFEGGTSYKIGGSVFAHFDVQANTVTYIGTLVLFFEGDSYHRYVTDEYEVAKENLRERFPQVSREAGKNLMTMEKRR
jgi:hypothetical protein